MLHTNLQPAFCSKMILYDDTNDTALQNPGTGTWTLRERLYRRPRISRLVLEHGQRRSHLASVERIYLLLTFHGVLRNPPRFRHNGFVPRFADNGFWCFMIFLAAAAAAAAVVAAAVSGARPYTL